MHQQQIKFIQLQSRAGFGVLLLSIWLQCTVCTCSHCSAQCTRELQQMQQNYTAEALPAHSTAVPAQSKTQFFS